MKNMFSAGIILINAGGSIAFGEISIKNYF